MAISAKDVMELRKQTDCGMMECKKALTQADGDFAKAIEILREQGQSEALADQVWSYYTSEKVYLEAYYCIQLR